jgi:hypothetical protein
MPMSRRHALVCLASMGVQPAHAAQAVALPDFDGDPELARAITEIIAANLSQRSIEIAPDASTRLSGRIIRQRDGRIMIEFRLLAGGTQLAGQKYFITPDNFRRIGNIISDVVYGRLAGPS